MRRDVLAILTEHEECWIFFVVVFRKIDTVPKVVELRGIDFQQHIEACRVHIRGEVVVWTGPYLEWTSSEEEWNAHTCGYGGLLIVDGEFWMILIDEHWTKWVAAVLLDLSLVCNLDCFQPSRLVEDNEGARVLVLVSIKDIAVLKDEIRENSEIVEGEISVNGTKTDRGILLQSHDDHRAPDVGGRRLRSHSEAFGGFNELIDTDIVIIVFSSRDLDCPIKISMRETCLGARSKPVIKDRRTGFDLI